MYSKSETSQECLPKCIYKYINYTEDQGDKTSRNIAIGARNWRGDQSCFSCDYHFNSQYQDYCVFKDLLKPYQNYNSFLMDDIKGSDLQFLAFFCSTLQNQTSCQHLANLCVLSHYSFYKNSPCRRFVTSQTTSIVYSMEQLMQSAPEESETPAVTPFLYYSKGKETTRLIQEPIAV